MDLWWLETHESRSQDRYGSYTYRYIYVHQTPDTRATKAYFEWVLDTGWDWSVFLTALKIPHQNRSLMTWVSWEQSSGQIRYPTDVYSKYKHSVVLVLQGVVRVGFRYQAGLISVPNCSVNPTSKWISDDLRLMRAELMTDTDPTDVYSKYKHRLMLVLQGLVWVGFRYRLGSINVPNCSESPHQSGSLMTWDSREQSSGQIWILQIYTVYISIA